MKKRGEFKLRYHPAVVREDISRLDSGAARRIRRAIENKLSLAPLIYGEPLRGSLHPLWKLRVGDWRILYQVTSGEVCILFIAHRSEIYTLAQKIIEARQ